jgi:hypothetical protein
MSRDEDDLTFVETTQADDVIEGRSPRLPERWTVRPWWLGVLALAVLAAGIGIGYALGRNTSKAAPATTHPSLPPPAGVVLADLPQLTTTGRVCSAQLPGTHRLKLGIQVQNSGGAPLQISHAEGVFPLGYLRMVSAAVGQCDDAGAPVGGNWVRAGATAWLRLTVEVLVPCPAPAPVQFQVDYTGGIPPASVTLTGFPDLGSVRYSGC